MMRRCISLLPLIGKTIRSHFSHYAMACFICLLVGLWHMPFVVAQECLLTQMDPKYLIEKEPKKVALVIGNKNYKHLSPIESAQMDGEMMTSRLTELGFDVVYRPD